MTSVAILVARASCTSDSSFITRLSQDGRLLSMQLREWHELGAVDCITGIWLGNRASLLKSARIRRIHSLTEFRLAIKLIAAECFTYYLGGRKLWQHFKKLKTSNYLYSRLSNHCYTIFWHNNFYDISKSGFFSQWHFWNRLYSHAILRIHNCIAKIKDILEATKST